MSTTTPFNLTIVLPPNRQYYVSYFYPYAYSGNSIATCKYRSNVTTTLEEGWHSADIYNEFWKDNPTRGDPITGNIYRVPFIFDYNVQFQFSACTYFVFSWYEGNELKYFVYAIDKNGGHSGNTYESYDYRQYMVTDEYGSLLVYVGFLNDYAMQVYAPGRKICNYTLGINDALFRTSNYDKGVNFFNLNTFPYDVLVNGYYVVTYPDSVIEGTYQLQDGYNIGYKIPELTNGSLKHSLGQINWYASQIDDYITIYRFKFTKTNDSDPNRTLFRIMHFYSTGVITGDLNMFGDLWIDSETKELKIWSWVINPAQRVLKQLPDDALYAWHELAIPWATYGDLKGFYWDGEYIDLVEICGETVTTSFRQTILAGFPEVDAGLYPDRGYGKNKSILLDYAALHINSNSHPYVMKDNYFNYYDPILPEPEPEPEPIEPEEPTGIIIKGHVYLVCYKGDTSIYDNLIRIVKTNIASKLPSPKPDFYKGVFIPPLHEPPHLNNLLPKGYPVHDYHPIPDINSYYTHVGLLVATKSMLIPEEITYYACREDNGVFMYSEPIKCVDLFDLKHLTVPVKQIDSFYNKTKTKNIEGSMVGDMGYRIMMRPNSMSSIEWVARALNLGFPRRYTINRLIKFSKIEE